MASPITRRYLLKAIAGAAASLPFPALSAASPRDRLVIVNADDLGMCVEVDRGILDAHDHGIVTSASVLVDGPTVEQAIAEARKRPNLGLGIHVAFDLDRTRRVDVQDLGLVQREVERQLDRFARLTGAPPDHIDSHHHVHRRFNVARLFLDAGRRLGVPVRGFSDVLFVGRFYGQVELGQADLSRISVEALMALLRSLPPGVSEVSCHPGRVQAQADLYNRERELEVSALTDPRVKSLITAEGIRLINYRDYARSRAM